MGKQRKHSEKYKKKEPKQDSYRAIVVKTGRIGNEVGKAGERRVYEACKNGEKPSWWKGIRYATPDEDGRGIDHIIETDVGDIYLQTKTSLSEPVRHRPSRNDRDVAIIYVNLKDSDEEIRKKVILIIAREREQKLLKRKDPRP